MIKCQCENSIAPFKCPLIKTIIGDKELELCKNDNPFYVKARNRKTKSRGLGDTVAKAARATGIAQTVNFISSVTGIPCGCEERQDALNKLFPY